MADHKHGEMNTKVQEQTFTGFLSFIKWVAILSICTLIFMAIVNG